MAFDNCQFTHRRQSPARNVALVIHFDLQLELEATVWQTIAFNDAFPITGNTVVLSLNHNQTHQSCVRSRNRKMIAACWHVVFDAFAGELHRELVIVCRDFALQFTVLYLRNVFYNASLIFSFELEFSLFPIKFYVSNFSFATRGQNVSRQFVAFNI